jgi:hypothetical protein
MTYNSVRGAKGHLKSCFSSANALVVDSPPTSHEFLSLAWPRISCRRSSRGLLKKPAHLELIHGPKRFVDQLLRQLA